VEYGNERDMNNVGATGSISGAFNKYLEDIPRIESIAELQKMAILR
jgi:hypothetical protein